VEFNGRCNDGIGVGHPLQNDLENVVRPSQKKHRPKRTGMQAAAAVQAARFGCSVLLFVVVAAAAAVLRAVVRPLS
jgi:hypothetical protein